MHMIELKATMDGKSKIRTMNVWEYILFVSLPIVLTVAFSIYVFDLFPEKSEYFETGNMPSATYKIYSQRLNAISEKYAKEMEAIEKAK